MPKKYRILLSAYACEPNKGSEPGVGWNWAIEIADRGHEVWVITRQNNRLSIETYFSKNVQPSNLHFIYYDVPKWLSWWKKGTRGVHLYYYLWQIGIVSLAKKIHKQVKFDIVHHITFVTIHQPSFLFLLKNTKFIYGPAAGGDIIESRFLNSFPINDKVREILRFFQCRFLSLDPIRLWMYRNTNIIYCNSNQTKSFIPKKTKNNVRLSLAIGVATNISNLQVHAPIVSSKLKLLYVGNFLHLKGYHLALKAFYKLEDYQSNIEFTLIGKFNSKVKFEKNNNLTVHSWVPQKKLIQMYSEYDVLLFPSFRDSGGMVVVEAMSKGLPVICLNLGGPGQIVNESCGRVISTKNRTEEQVVDALSTAIFELKNNPDLRKSLSEGAVKRASEFTWDKTVDRVYSEIEKYMNNVDKTN